MGKVNWKFQDELGLDLNRYKSIDQTTGEEKDIKLIRNAQLSQTGTLLNSTNLNALIDAINENYDEYEFSSIDHDGRIYDLEEGYDEINNKVSTNTTNIANLKEQVITNESNTNAKVDIIRIKLSDTSPSLSTIMQAIYDDAIDSQAGKIFVCIVDSKHVSSYYSFIAKFSEIQLDTYRLTLFDIESLETHWCNFYQDGIDGDIYTTSLSPKPTKKLYSHNIKLYDSTNTKTTIFITLQNEYSGTINAGNITDYLDLNKYIQANGSFTNTAGTGKNVYALQIYKNTSNAYRYRFQCFDSTEEISITSLICSDSVQPIGEF